MSLKLSGAPFHPIQFAAYSDLTALNCTTLNNSLFLRGKYLADDPIGLFEKEG